MAIFLNSLRLSEKRVPLIKLTLSYSFLQLAFWRSVATTIVKPVKAVFFVFLSNIGKEV